VVEQRCIRMCPPLSGPAICSGTCQSPQWAHRQPMVAQCTEVLNHLRRDVVNVLRFGPAVLLSGRRR